MKIPILNGVYLDGNQTIRTGYPVNLVPVPNKSGISDSYLKQAEGIIEVSEYSHKDRGGYNWNGVLYRVMGTSLVSITQYGVITKLGDVGGNDSGHVTFSNSFDRLAIVSGGALYYWNGISLTKVTDIDLGFVIDVIWVDGYFVLTDGEYLIVTDLDNPLSINPLKYGSSEADPDPVKALLKLRNEVYALNRNTIEVFDNVAGEFFPFQRIEGAQAQKGTVGTKACCVFNQSIAFIGSGKNEPTAVYIASNATVNKISTNEIDRVLNSFTEDELSKITVEAREKETSQYLYIHLPDRTLVFDFAASIALSDNIWFVLSSSLGGFSQYRARNFVFAYNKWNVADTKTGKIGYFSEAVSSHWGEIVSWEFSTTVIYPEGRKALINSLELVTVSGNIEVGKKPAISTSYSVDGRSWSMDRVIYVGSTGDSVKRIVWFKLGQIKHWRIQRFKGDSQCHASFIRLEANMEVMDY